MADRRNLTTNEIALKETKLLYKMRTKHQILAKSLAGVEYDVYIENYCYKSGIKRFKVSR